VSCSSSSPQFVLGASTIARSRSIAIIAFLFVASTASADDPPQRAPEPEINFQSLPDVIPTASIQLANGTEVINIAAWSAVAIARVKDGRICTATLIGPRVLLTAAHCVDAADVNNITRTIGGTVTFGGSEIPLLSCSMHPAYGHAPVAPEGQPRASEDFALCELAAPVTNVTQETLDSGGPMVKAEPLLMTGFGCTNIRVVGDQFVYVAGDDKLRMGDAKVDAVGVLDETGAAGQYLRTRSRKVEPILCPGDSGGPAFRGASLQRQDGPKRRVVAVNSKVVAVFEDNDYTYFSFVATTLAPAFKTFQKDWSNENPQTRGVCGVDLVAGRGNCRL
jgi:hypothetical protein